VTRFAEARAALQSNASLRDETDALLRAQADSALAETTPPWPAPLAPEALYGLPGEIVRAIEPHSEADPAALLIQLLVALGNVIGRGPQFIVEQCPHHINLFAVIVGQTAKARKGTSWARILALLLTVDPFWAENRIHGGVGSGEGIIWAVRDPILKGDKLIDEGVADKRILLHESEFAQILAVIQRSGDTTSEVLRRVWDGAPLQTLTKNSPARATGAHVSVIGHITASELVRRLHETEVANGLANRVIFCCARRHKELPDGGNLEWSRYPHLIEKVSTAMAFATTVDRMERDSTARDLWHEVYHDLSEGRAGLLGAVTSRAEAQVLRLSMIYALLDRSPVIRREHLAAALAVWRYADDSCRHIFGDSLGDGTADEILRALRANPEGLTRTQIRDLFSRHKPESEIGRALGTLQKHGRAECSAEETGGRPSERWFGNATKAT
jgi:hypothetical protein